MNDTSHSDYARRYDSEAKIRALVDGVLNGTWPEPDWKHREHCVATAGLMLLKPEIDLDRELPGIIQRYNVAQGGANTDTEGYHHTITLLYLAAIRDFLRRAAVGIDPVEAVRQLLLSPVGRKDYPFTYYRRETLFSKDARRGWIAPDLAQPSYPVGPV